MPRHVMRRFIEEHSGFLIKEVINSEVESAERLQWMLQTGGMLWNPLAGRYEKSLKKDLNEIVRKPHFVGVTREIEHGRSDSWAYSSVGALFDYSPPRCGFSRSEQRMLLIAIDGESDQELSQKLRVSLSTVKKMWLSVYRRVADRLPGLDPKRLHTDAWTTQRGKEKKRGLMAYLRKHPEELRPVNMKLLRQATAGRVRDSVADG